MAYDFSKIGLEGQEAYDQHMQTQANTALIKANAVAKEQEVEEQQRALDLDLQVSMQDINAGVTKDGEQETPTSRANALMRSGDIYRHGGAPKRALDFYKAAMDMMKDEATIGKDEMEIQIKNLQREKATADYVDRMVGTTVKNQSQYEYGVHQIMQSDLFTDTEKREMLKMLPPQWTQETSDFWSQHALDAKDRATIAEQKIDDDRQERSQQQSAMYQGATLARLDAASQETARHNRVTESQGKSSATPNEGQVKGAAAVLKNQFPEMPKEALDAASQSVSATALQMLRDNPSLDWNTALNRAVMQGQNAGDFESDSSWSPGIMPWNWADEEKTVKFDQKGTGADNAIEIPKTKDGKAASTKMVKGRWYNTKRGPAMWNGEAFEQP